MSYSAPPNFTTGAVVVESELDTLSDDITFLANPPKARVYNSANLTLTTATLTALTFNTERQDSDTMHSTATNTSRLTFTTAGFYVIGGHARFAANATGYRELQFRLNGTTNIAAVIDHTATAVARELCLTTGYQFAAGDYVELMAYQTSGGNLDVEATGNHSPEAWAIWQAL